MNPSAATFARGVAMAIVLIVAAIAGLVVGYALDARDGNSPAGGPGPFPNVWGNHAVDDTSAAGAPSYADPYLQRIQDGEAAPQAGDAVYENVWGNHADAGGASADSLTAPTPR